MTKLTKAPPHMTENNGKDVGYGFDVVVESARECEVRVSAANRIVSSTAREVDVVIGRVLNGTATTNGNLLRSQGTVVKITLDVVVDTELVCDHL